MNYKIEFTKQAQKQLASIPVKQRKLITAWIDLNLSGCENPRFVHGGKSLQGTDNGWRYRVGSYRIIARIEDDKMLILVVRIGHRQGVYGNFTGSSVFRI
jgi:mRNA interferase RelE/StbE